ncbi:MAG: hypothetical protein IT457_23030 [Planctomycetes bacterium]|nr:hypothetical protein [Planctomycetota bacterium]
MTKHRAAPARRVAPSPVLPVLVTLLAACAAPGVEIVPQPEDFALVTIQLQG